ncbi:MAG: trypsin-like serine protease [Eubacterium sp.]|nr:trypsin-like serine protease [Eubacterium sp.]
MDENNNTNQENGFVLQDTPTSEPVQQQTIQPELQKEEQPEQQAQQESRFQAQPEPQPQPMPSGDNTYRFQNTETRRMPGGSERKKGVPVTKLIVSAVVFGVVAAACFFGVTKLLTFAAGGSSSSDIGQTQPKIPVTTVSGTAASQVGVSDIVEQVMPSIVAITEKSTRTSYFGQTYSSEGAGSGFIVKQDNDQLLIVTNNHVVANADKISVQFNDGESVEADVKGTSESHDLAVLTVPLNKLKDSTKGKIKVASLGSSNDARVGQMVIAIGNALGYGQSVTVGYLSAKNREVSASDNSGKSTTQILLQTDAAINPGNSGGALIDTNGNVIGINSSKYFSYGNTSVEGMGYAIPMSDAVSIINDLMDRQVLKDEEKGYLGITGRTIDETVSQSYGLPVGVYVAAVSDTGAAYKAGIKQGDVITRINDREVKTINEVQEIVNSTKVGTEITVLLKRSSDGEYKEKEDKVTLKSKDTLDSLDDGTDGSGRNDGTQENDPNNWINPNNPQSNGNYNQDNDSQVIPWGSIY